MDDSRQNKVPMELLMGKQFKMPVLEEFIRTMRVGEVASFSAISSLCTNYPFVSKQYRAYVKSKTRDKNDPEEPTPARHCCGIQMQTGTGHADLDVLTTKPKKMEFQIELMSLEKPEEYERELWQMTDDEKTVSLPQLREDGNKLYREGKTEEASQVYGKALTMLEQLQLKEKPGDEEWNELESLRLPLLSNFSQCRLTLKDYYPVINYTNQILDKDPKNVKAWFRRGKAHAAVWDFEKARKDFEHVKVLDAKMCSVVDKEVSNMSQIEKTKSTDERKRLEGKLFS